MHAKGLTHYQGFLAFNSIGTLQWLWTDRRTFGLETAHPQEENCINLSWRLLERERNYITQIRNTFLAYFHDGYEQNYDINFIQSLSSFRCTSNSTFLQLISESVNYVSTSPHCSIHNIFIDFFPPVSIFYPGSLLSFTFTFVLFDLFSVYVWLVYARYQKSNTFAYD